MRGKGIGSKLFDKVILYGKKIGAKRISWNVIDWNKNAIDFYNISGAKVLQDWRTVQMDYETMDKYLKNIN